MTFARVLRGETYRGETSLEIEECGVCGVLFAAPQALLERARRDHSIRFFCPNGHNLAYIGKTEAQKLRERLERVEQSQRATRDLLEHEQRSHAATKGHLTRTKKRAAAAMCPVPGCGRHFQQLARHIAAKHPDYAAEHDHA